MAPTRLSNDEVQLWHICVFVHQQHGNETEHPRERGHPPAVQVVLDSFYVDNGLTGANSIEEAVRLRKALQELFALGGFVFHKWITSESAVAKQVPSHLLDKEASQEITCTYTFIKVLGVGTDCDSINCHLSFGL